MPFTSDTHAMTEEELISELNDITIRLHEYINDPTKFGELIGGSIKLDIPKYVEFLQKRENIIRERLESLPYFEQSDLLIGL